MASYAQSASSQTVLQFDLRGHFNSFQRPSFNDIIKSAKVAYPNDGGLIVKEKSGRLLGIFTIYSQSAPKEHLLRFSKKKRDSEVVETVEIPLTPPMQRRERERDGLLVTIVDADIGTAHSIPGRDFDSALGEYGSIERGTQSQTYRESSVFNGNRFAVIKKNEEKDLPNRLTVGEHSFLIKYKNKKWLCHSCKEEHIGACPYLQELYATKERRRLRAISHHVCSDSSLRYAEQTGLRADISVFSGATVGQLANVLQDDPDSARHQNVIVAGGANDVKVDDTESDQHIAKRIESSLMSLQDLVSTDSSKNFHIMNTCPPVKEPTRRQFIAREFFNLKLKKLCTSYDNLELVKLPQDENGWEDNHPTIAHTAVILNALMKDLEEDILINPKVITARRMYRGVDAHYLSGCSGCLTDGLFEDGGFCGACVTRMTKKKLHDDKLFKKVLNLALEKFPPGTKRQHSDEDDNGCKKSN